MKKLLIVLLAVVPTLAFLGCGDSSHKTTLPTLVASYISRAKTDSNTPHLYTLNVSAKSSTLVNIPIPQSAEYVSANWQATAVAYCRDNTATGWDIFTMGTDGVEHQVTTKMDACEATFSADGKSIVFVGYAATPDAYLAYTIGVDGSNQKLIYSETSDQYNPAFSPDGSTVVLYRDIPSPSGGASGVVANAARRSNAWQQKRMNHAAARRYRMKDSPAAATASAGLYTISLTAASATPTLLYASNDDWPAVYTLDGSMVLTTLCVTNACDVYSMKADGTGTPAKLTSAIYNSSTEEDWAGCPMPYNSQILYNYWTNSETTSARTLDIRLMNQDGSNSSVIMSSDVSTSSSTEEYIFLNDWWWSD